MSNNPRYSNPRGARTGLVRRQPPLAAHDFGLTLDADSPKGQSAHRSPDPYNSSGSFDRTKNWARIGKR